jgi:L-fuconate dehydratase
MFDYIAVSGRLENRVVEYVDHLHEHFEDPVVIKNGNYRPPANPGYSITLKNNVFDLYAFPEGKVWQPQ